MTALLLSELLPVASFLFAGPRPPPLMTPRRCGAPHGPVMMAGFGGGGFGSVSGNFDDKAIGEHVSKSGNCLEVMRGLDTVSVLVFNAGSDDESVYTLQGRSVRGFFCNVLAFERANDAEVFAKLLQAEGFDLATPSSWDADQLNTYCMTGAFEVSLVLHPSGITPPSRQAYDEDAHHRLNWRDRIQPGTDTTGQDGPLGPRIRWETMNSAGGEQRRYPGDGSGAPDPFAESRKRLEGALSLDADGCSEEEGCFTWEDPESSHDGGR